ncbi:hypothetical protein GGR57DRAFT_460508 [Xylariaceae sp. FL1272]|nr:hypothetical protein GGR57DRAFT_460508 [Xylariaceae sp. FL1272]
MGAKSGLALKFLQWFVRGIQFGACAVTLALFSYILALGSSRHITLPTWTRAVEGISGIGVIYTLLGLLLLCCLAGHPFTSFIAIVLDIAFVGAFVYVAQAVRGGGSSCKGTVNTPFGNKPATDDITNGESPTYGSICKMETAVLAVSIVAIIFFIISALLEFVLVRHRRKEARFGPSPANNYTSGYAKRRGFFGMFRRKKADEEAMNPNALPEHTHPNQVRQSYNTDTTAVGGTELGNYNKYDHGRFSHDGQTAYPETNPYTGGGHYGDGTYNTTR